MADPPTTCAKEKPTPISHIFFSTDASWWHPNSPATPWGGSPPRPLCQKICYSDCTENCPLRPLRAQLASPTLLGDVVGQNSARADSGIIGWADIPGDIWGDIWVDL